MTLDLDHHKSTKGVLAVRLASVKQASPQISDMLSFIARPGRFSFFIPSFLVAKSAKSTNQHGGVSSLDGLRGLACVFVVHEHVLYNFSQAFLWNFGHDGYHYIIQVPFIRLLVSGSAMVNIFFVISGYVLTYKPFLQIHQGDAAAARATISSSTFRRVPRLYLPMWFMVFVCGFIAWLGLFNPARAVWYTKDNVYQLHEGTPLYFGNFWLQMKDTLKCAWKTLNIFTMKDRLVHAEHYDMHTWTIPVEFRCSMILFAVVSAITEFKMRYRIAVLLLVTICVMVMQQPNTMLFLIGAALADFDHLVRKVLHRSQNQAEHDIKSPFDKLIIKWLQPDNKTYVVLFVTGLFVLGCPSYGRGGDPFYSILTRNIPFQQFAGSDAWLRLYGSVMVVWAVANSTRLRPIFVNPVATYLGKISFALYLVHGNLIKIVLYPAIPVIYRMTGDGTWKDQTVAQRTMSFFLGYLVVVPLSFYIADLFCRGVDIPLTRWGRKLELSMMQEKRQITPLLK